MNYPASLLKQSRALLRVDPKRPTQANVRRAVSSGYYAVYHYLLELTSEVLFGKTKNRKVIRTLFVRNSDHSRLVDVAKRLTKHADQTNLRLAGKGQVQLSTRMEYLFGNEPLPEQLSRFCEVFAILQQQRHKADYDLTFIYSKYEADDIVNAAEEALQNLLTLTKSHPEQLANFGAVVLYGPEFRH